MEFLHDLVRLYELIRDNGTSAFLSIVGLILFAIAFIFARKAVEEKKTAPSWLKICLLTSLIAAILASIAAPSLRMLELSHRHGGAAPLTPTQILENLRTNTRVTWVLRLIPYNSGNRDKLGIESLKKVGIATQQYVFVADYAELRGRTVADAVVKVGGSMNQITGVSAILFPLASHLYPANARGLLQIIRDVDQKCAANPTVCSAQPGYKSFNIEKQLSKEEVDDLSETEAIESWSWEKYKRFYNHYCQMVQTFRCADLPSQFSASPLIGKLSRDWFPLGFSQTSSVNPCAQKLESCSISAWEETKALVPQLGVRAFLIENYPLETLVGLRLIDFKNPQEETIPDLGVPLADQ
jgi:hypothetical protein